MKDMRIPFSPPYIDDDVKNEVIQVLNSGWITTGHKVRELEQIISQRAGVSHTVACNSATSALMLVLHWFGVKKGDEVIIPAYTYAATCLAVMHVGAVPVMIDCEDDFNISVDAIESKINSKTKVIIPVDIAGWPCDYDQIFHLVEKRKAEFKGENANQRGLGRILVLSDAAHSLGASYNGMPSGSLADITVFSFHAVKNVTTAEGGAICLNLPPIFDAEGVSKSMKLWTLNGQTKDALTKTEQGSWKYDIIYPGFKMNMPDLCAAVGVAQLRKYWDDLLPQRKSVFMAYEQALRKYAWVELPPSSTNNKSSSCHVFALRILGITEDQRDRVIELVTSHGVAVNVHFRPLPMLSVFMEMGFQIADFPNAFNNYSREISLPVYPGLDQEKVDYIVQAIVDSYNRVVNA